jgi:hypothetical protein
MREIDQAIAKLQRRIDEIRALDPCTTQYDHPNVEVARSNIVRTILDVFGPDSPEYREHQDHNWSGPR